MKKMLKKRFCLDIFSFLFLSSTALFAADLVVPAIKAPYSIKNAQFDKSGDTFAYEVNGKIYVRDSLSLILKDSYNANSGTDFSAFYTTPSKVDYPKITATPNGKSIIIQSQKNASGGMETKTVDNLPSNVKSASVNKMQTHVAFITTDGNAYVYDLRTNSEVMKTPYNASTTGISFTKDNKVLFSDSAKTVGLYNINGQKQKSYTSAGNVRSVNLSSDEETLMISDTNGTLNFYNTNSASQIGYVPNMGSKLIKDVKLSKDSRRVLITGENNTLYIAPTQDVLFSQNTVAPTPKLFSINYNAYDPNDRASAAVTEFGVTEFRSQVDDTDAEYILSTREKNLGKQKFELDEEHKAGETVVITNQPDQALFPPSLKDKDREALFTEKNPYGENKVAITEYKQPSDYPAPYELPEAERLAQVQPKTFVKPPVVPGGSGVTTINGQPVPAGNVTINVYGGEGTDSSTTTATSTTTTVTKTKEELKAERLAIKEAEKAERIALREAEKAEKQAAKEAKKAEKETEKQKKKEEPEQVNPFKKIKDFFEQEDIKTYYKDGHGLVFDVGIGTLKSPYLFDFSFITGYLNYDLIQPFYLGGITQVSLGLPNTSFPYKYANSSGLMRNPYLTNVFFTTPIGFSIYPWKNSVEFYVELDPGVILYKLWNGEFGGQSIAGQFYPSFCADLKIGAAWDFINLSCCLAYDVLQGVNFEAHLGVIINVGGTRTIGSLVQETKE